MRGKAEPIITPTGGDEYDPSKVPTADEVRKSVRKDAKRLLVPYSRKAQRQRGLTKTIARMRVV